MRLTTSMKQALRLAGRNRFFTVPYIGKEARTADCLKRRGLVEFVSDDVGITYQLTAEGRQVLNRLTP